MDAVILTMLGLMGSWNVAVTFWMLRTTRARNNKKYNPHPPCEEHGKTLVRLEGVIESMREEVGDTQQVVAVLWNEAHPGRPMPKG